MLDNKRIFTDMLNEFGNLLRIEVTMSLMRSLCVSRAHP